MSNKKNGEVVSIIVITKNKTEFRCEHQMTNTFIVKSVTVDYLKRRLTQILKDPELQMNLDIQEKQDVNDLMYR